MGKIATCCIIDTWYGIIKVCKSARWIMMSRWRNLPTFIHLPTYLHPYLHTYLISTPTYLPPCPQDINSRTGKKRSSSSSSISTIASSRFGSPTRIINFFRHKDDDDDEDNIIINTSSKASTTGGVVVDSDAWKVLALSFLCMIICSLDRVAMSVAILPMSLEFGYVHRL